MSFLYKFPLLGKKLYFSNLINNQVNKFEFILDDVRKDFDVHISLFICS